VLDLEEEDVVFPDERLELEELTLPLRVELEELFEEELGLRE
jgi:hypothetical protein